LWKKIGPRDPMFFRIAINKRPQAAGGYGGTAKAAKSGARHRDLTVANPAQERHRGAERPVESSEGVTIP
jgi:hypothetical protein